MENIDFPDIKSGSTKALARAISLVENEVAGFEGFLQNLIPSNHTKVVGVTGPPGAGKSTLTDALIETLVADNKKVAVICVDPSSPFNQGAILGDRIRMSEWYTNPNVYIRSLASRGSLGGLHPKIIEITDILKSANFDYVIVETVGVGQSEIEIAGLADVTIVVLVPESGDDIQNMKAGLMEIADIFVVNKSDRPGAESFFNQLKSMLSPSFRKFHHEIPVIPTVSTEKKGIVLLKDSIVSVEKSVNEEKKLWLWVEKAYQLIASKRMKNVKKSALYDYVKDSQGKINLYQFVSNYESS